MADRKVTVILALDVGPYLAGGKQAVQINTRLVDSLNSIASDTKRAGDTVSHSTEQMRGGFSRSALAASLMSGNLAQVAQVATGFFAGQLFVRGAQAISQGFKAVITDGAALNETITKTQFAFGAASGDIIGQADQMAQQFGVAKGQFIDAADTIGLIGKAAGLAAPQAAQMGAQFATLATDVSSFYNVPVADALNAIQSGLVGQERPLRQYGVLLDAASVKAEALHLGIAQGSGDLTEQQAVIARASLITQGFADASGDLERTQSSVSNRFRAISGDIHNYSAALGLELQPAIGHVLDDLYKLGQGGVSLEHQFAPLFSSWAKNWESQAVIVGHLLGILGQVGGAVGHIAIPGAATSLTGLQETLTGLTGSIAGSRSETLLLAGVLAGPLIAALATATAMGGGLSAVLGGFAEAHPAVALLAVATAVGAVSKELSSLSNGSTSLQHVSTDLVRLGQSSQVAGDLARKYGADLHGVADVLDLIEHKGQRSTIDLLTSRHALDLVNPLAQHNNLSQAKADLDQIDKEMAKLVTGGHADVAAQVFTQLSAAVRDHGGSVADLKKNLNDYAAAQDNANAQARLGMTATHGETAAVLDLANAVSGLPSLLGAVNLGYLAATQGAGELNDRQKVLQQSNSTALDVGTALTSAVSDQNAAMTASSKSTETAAQKAHALASAYLGVDTALARAGDSQRKLDDLQHGGQVRELTTAERDLSAALDGQTRSVDALFDAEQKLEDQRNAAQSGRTLDELNIALQRAQIRKDQADLASKAAGDKSAYANQVGIPEEVVASADELKGALLDSREAAYGVQDAQLALNRAQGDNGSIARSLQTAQLDVADAQRGVASSADQATAATKSLMDLQNGGLEREMAAAMLDLRGAVLGVAQAQDAVTTALNKSADAGANNASKIDAQTLSLDAWKRKLEEANRTTATWNDDLLDLAHRVPPEVLAALQGMGIQGAGIIHQLRNANKSEFDTIVRDVQTSTALQSNSYISGLDAMFRQAGQTMTTGGGLTGQSLIDALGGKTAGLSDVMTTFLMTLTNALNSLLGGIGAKQIEAQRIQTVYGQVGTSQNVLRDQFGAATGGVFDAHITKSPTILYGERETGQEAFIPQRGGSPAKMKDVLATAASWYGLGVIPMAAGGVLPSTPDLSAYGSWLGYTGQSSADYVHAAAANYLAQKGATAAAPAAPAGGALGSGWRSITDYLDGAHVAYTVTSTTGGQHVQGSLHYLGKAVDLVGRAGSSMRDVFNALAAPGGAAGPVHGINELFHDPVGYYYDLGKFRTGAIGGHSDHVHAATFDNGGMLMPGQLGVNMTRTPERVLSPTQTMAYGNTISRPSVTLSAPITVHVHVPSGAVTDVPTLTRAMTDAATDVVQNAFDRYADAVGAK